MTKKSGVEYLAQHAGCKSKGKKSRSNPKAKTLYRYADDNTHTDNLTMAEAQKFQRMQGGGTITPMSKISADDRECSCPQQSWYGGVHASDCAFAGQPYDPLGIFSPSGAKRHHTTVSGKQITKQVAEARAGLIPESDWLEREHAAITVAGFDREELATVLAALRLFQKTYEGKDADWIRGEWPEHFEDDGELIEPLSMDDIGNLCERINCSGEHTQAEVDAVTAMRRALVEINDACAKDDAINHSGRIADAIRILQSAVSKSGIPVESIPAVPATEALKPADADTKKFSVLRTIDAFVTYVAGIPADTAEEAVQLAEENEGDYIWEHDGTSEYDARNFVALDEDGQPIEDTRRGDL